jgi:hypothetical protein
MVSIFFGAEKGKTDEQRWVALRGLLLLILVIQKKKDKSITAFVIQIGQPEGENIYFPGLVPAKTHGFSDCRVVDNLYHPGLDSFLELDIFDLFDGFFLMGVVGNSHHDASSSINALLSFVLNAPF